MRKKINPALAGLAAATLAVAGISPAPTPVPAPVQQSGVTAQQTRASHDQAPAPQTQATAMDLAALGFGRVPARLRRHEPVWIGYPRPENHHKPLRRFRHGRGANGGVSKWS